MVYLYIGGNLGNQMIQYAFARRLIERRNGSGKEELYINFDLARTINHDVKYAINFYNIMPYDKYSGKTPVSLFVRCIRFFLYQIDFKYRLNVISKLGLYQYERGAAYKDISHRKRVVVSGTFEHSFYLDEIRDILLKEFQPKYEISPTVKNIYKKMETKEAICISVRVWKQKRHLRESRIQLSEDFFEREIALLIDRVKDKENIVFYITSNDIEWCKNNLNLKKYEVVWDSEEFQVYEKIELMKKCKYFGLSNSTFSWMGAYLSQREDKTVVLPYIENNGLFSERVPLGVEKENWILLDEYTGEHKIFDRI